MLFFSCLLFTSCVSCGGDAPQQGPKQKPLSKRVFIVLDNSSSVNRANFEIINRSIDELVSSFDKNYNIFLFTTDVTDRSTQHPAGEFVFKLPKTLKPTERKMMEDSIAHLSDRFRKDVERAMEDKPNKTCVLSALKSIYSFIKSSAEYKNYLLIISDMLECCKYGCPDNQAEFGALANKVKNYQLENYHLSEYIPLENIAVVYATEALSQKEGELIESPEFKSFWQKAFGAMGYEDMPVFGPSAERFLSGLRGR